MLQKETLLSLVKRPDLIAYWQSLSKREVEDMLGPQAAAMVGFDQHNPHHCYDLMNHSLHTVWEIQRQLADRLIDWQDNLLTAGLFHDVGKPVVARQKEDRLVFYGHAAKSAQICRALLPQLGFDHVQTQRICFFITHHDDYIAFLLPEEAVERFASYKKADHAQVLKHFRTCAQKESLAQLGVKQKALWQALLVLCYADVRAQAEVVVYHGVVTDSRAHKEKKLDCIAQILADLSEEELEQDS